MKNKKILVLTAVAVILVSGITVYAVKKSTGEKVPVYSVSDISEGMGGDYESMLPGVISSEVNQEIKYNKDQKVEEIFVTNGQKVKKGDKLISFDQTSADINLQMKKLDKEGIGIEIKKLRRDITNLKNTKPTPPMPDISEEPTIPEEPETPVNPDIPTEPVLAEEVLDEHSLPYTGKGTTNDPFHYLVSQKGTITGKFLNKLAREKQLFVIEVRQGDVSTGEIMKFYGQKMSEKDAVEDDNAKYNLALSFSKQIEEEKDIPAYEILSKEIVEKQGWVSGKGTNDSPYVFLVKDNGIVKGSFFNYMKENNYYFRLEVRENNKNNGIVVKAWEQNGKYIKDVKDIDEYEVAIKAKTSEIKPEETKPEEVKQEQPKPEEPKQEEPTQEEPKTEENLQSKIISNSVRVVNAVTVNYVMEEGAESSSSDIRSQISQIESQIKELQLNEREAEIEIRNMEKQLENKTIVSAINGIVTTLGDPDTPSTDGSPLLVVKAEDGLYLKGEIPENKLSTINKGTMLEGFASRNGIGFTAEITYVSPYPSGNKDMYGTESNNSMYPFTAYIENFEGLENDDYVDIRVSEESMMSAGDIKLMKPFVKYEDGKYFVMKVDKNNKLKKQYVSISGNSYFVTIKAGLKAEDKVAFPYGKNVKEGARTREADTDELYSEY